MKHLKLIAAFIITIIIGITLSSCNKTNDNKTSETATTNSGSQPQTIDNTTKDTSMKMNNDDMTKMQKDAEKNPNMQHAMIKIPSAQCDVCKENITKALKKVKGISNFTVDVDNHEVHLNFDKSLTNISKIESTITSAGYDANDKKADPDAYKNLDKCCKRPEDRK